MEIRRLSYIAFLLIVIILPHRAYADAGWQAGGVPVCSVLGTQETPSVLSLGADGTIIAWADARDNDYDIYAQRLDTTGRPLWTSGGVLVCGASGDQEFPTIVSDGAGGAIIVWQDSRAGDDGMDIYAERLDANGTALWQSDGIPVRSHTPDLFGNPPLAYSQVAVSDGAGGVIVAWRDTRDDLINGSTEVFCQRINPAGAPVWATNGVPVLTYGTKSPWTARSLLIAPDGSNGAIIGWQDNRNSAATGYDLYAQRINSTGVIVWTANGNVVCNATGDQAYYSDIVDMGSGNTVFVWEDKRSGTDYDVYAQKLNSAGAVQWATNGRPVIQYASDQRTPRVVADGSGGVIVAWQDSRSGAASPDIYSQRLSAAGDMQWATSGKPVCTAAGWQGRVRMVPSIGGNALMSWMDDRCDPSGVTLDYDIYAQLLNPSGVLSWQADGLPVSAATDSQRLQQIAGDSVGGAYLVWEDCRTGDWDIFAHRMLPTAPAIASNISLAKQCVDLSYVSLPQRAVTGVFSDGFYVEEPDRFAGVKVMPAEPVNVGDMVTVTGTLETTCERIIRAVSFVDVPGGSIPNPLGITPSKLGGSDSGLVPGVGGVLGLNNVGLLVRFAGQVLDKQTSPSTYFTVSDGNGEVQVLGTTTACIGSFVCVTGICSCDSGQPRVLLRTADDVQVVN